MILLNHDNGEVVLTVSAPRGKPGLAHVLRCQFRTDSVAEAVCRSLAKRLGLRRRGTAWIRVNSK